MNVKFSFEYFSVTVVSIKSQLSDIGCSRFFCAIHLVNSTVFPPFACCFILYSVK